MAEDSHVGNHGCYGGVTARIEDGSCTGSWVLPEVRHQSRCTNDKTDKSILAPNSKVCVVQIRGSNNRGTEARARDQDDDDVVGQMVGMWPQGVTHGFQPWKK